MDDDLDNDIAGEPEIVLIAAVGRNGVIGRDNGMPWRLPTDFKHFKKLTMGRPMVMGRKTFQSIGRPLPGRTSIVISRDPGYAAEGVLTASSLDAALMLAGAIAERDEVGEIFVVGGGQVYEEALPLAARVELTEVDLAPEGDTVFPVLDPRAWQEVARVRPERGAQDDAEMCFVTFRRRAR
jgi:dihydrofolate reductase